MRYISLILCFFCEMAWACSQTYLKEMPPEDKFLLAVEEAESVFVGKVVRLYRQPDQLEILKGYTGFVFEIMESIKGKHSPYVETTLSTRCGISGLPFAEDEEYWPSEIGEMFVVAAKLTENTDSVFAVWRYKNSEPLMYRIRISASKPIK